MDFNSIKNVNENILVFLAFAVYNSAHSLDYLSLEDLKVLKELLIKSVNEFDEEGYFVIDAEEMEYLIKHNMPTGIRSDKRQALELIKGLEEVIKELEAEKEKELK